jgi:hypothetical protein
MMAQELLTEIWKSWLNFPNVRAMPHTYRGRSRTELQELAGLGLSEFAALPPSLLAPLFAWASVSWLGDSC